MTGAIYGYDGDRHRNDEGDIRLYDGDRHRNDGPRDGSRAIKNGAQPAGASRFKSKNKLSAVLQVPADDTVRARIVVEFHVRILFSGFELGENLHRELLAEFHAPLVIAVDVPENALHEDLVFVHRDERTEGLRSHFLHHDAVRGLVAFEHLVRSEFRDFGVRLARSAEFRLRDFERLAVHQRFRLGEEVRKELAVMIADLVVAHRRSDEVAGNELGALVDELVEGVLAV